MNHDAILSKIKMINGVLFFSLPQTKGLNENKGLYSLSLISGEINYFSSQRQRFSLLEPYVFCLPWALIT